MVHGTASLCHPLYKHIVLFKNFIDDIFLRIFQPSAGGVRRCMGVCCVRASVLKWSSLHKLMSL